MEALLECPACHAAIEVAVTTTVIHVPACMSCGEELDAGVRVVGDYRVEVKGAVFYMVRWDHVRV